MLNLLSRSLFHSLLLSPLHCHLLPCLPSTRHLSLSLLHPPHSLCLTHQRKESRMAKVGKWADRYVETFTKLLIELTTIRNATVQDALSHPHPPLQQHLQNTTWNLWVWAPGLVSFPPVSPVGQERLQLPQNLSWSSQDWWRKLSWKRNRNMNSRWGTYVCMYVCMYLNTCTMSLVPLNALRGLFFSSHCVRCCNVLVVQLPYILYWITLVCYLSSASKDGESRVITHLTQPILSSLHPLAIVHRTVDSTRRQKVWGGSWSSAILPY